MLERGKAYIIKAGTIILVCNTVVQIMQSFNWQFQLVEEGAEGSSILASVAHPFAILFIPLGFGVWQLAAAAITGFIAKEMVVSSLSMFYGFSLTAAGTAVAAAMTGFTPLSAFSMLVFILLYVPCVAATSTMAKELGSAKWTAFSVCWQIGVAYVVSLLVHTVGLALGFV